MSQSDEDFRREDLRKGMRAAFEQTIEDHVERYVEVAHQGIVPNHHFAAASSECIDLYRDGYALSALMMSEAVAEGKEALLACSHLLDESPLGASRATGSART
jgi:hypothetical protein